jgi:hypothetical protein
MIKVKDVIATKKRYQKELTREAIRLLKASDTLEPTKEYKVIGKMQEIIALDNHLAVLYMLDPRMKL